MFFFNLNGFNITASSESTTSDFTLNDCFVVFLTVIILFHAFGVLSL